MVDAEVSDEQLANAHFRYPIQTPQNKEEFFNPFFSKLSGTSLLQEQIKQGLNQQQIKATWQQDLKNYNKMRQDYLLYN